MVQFRASKRSWRLNEGGWQLPAIVLEEIALSTVTTSVNGYKSLYFTGCKVRKLKTFYIIWKTS